jgi:hypothetical protein
MDCGQREAVPRTLWMLAMPSDPPSRELCVLDPSCRDAYWHSLVSKLVHANQQWRLFIPRRSSDIVLQTILASEYQLDPINRWCCEDSEPGSSKGEDGCRDTPSIRVKALTLLPPADFEVFGYRRSVSVARPGVHQQALGH